MRRYTATTALLDVNHDRATSVIRRELRQMILDNGQVELPDWSTLRVIGPFETFDASGAIRFEYRGAVECHSKNEMLARHQAALRPLPRLRSALAG